MSIRTAIETTVATLTALALFAGFLYWIHVEDVEGRTEASRALTGHVVEYHTMIDTAVYNRLTRLETKVDTQTVQISRQSTVLQSLDTRTKIILEAVIR